MADDAIEVAVEAVSQFGAGVLRDTVERVTREARLDVDRARAAADRDKACRVQAEDRADRAEVLRQKASHRADELYKQRDEAKRERDEARNERDHNAGLCLAAQRERDAAIADVVRLKADHQSACNLIADTHGAAVGKRGDAPIRGVVEDVVDLRQRWRDADQERKRLFMDRNDWARIALSGDSGAAAAKVTPVQRTSSLYEFDLVDGWRVGITAPQMECAAGGAAREIANLKRAVCELDDDRAALVRGFRELVLRLTGGRTAGPLLGYAEGAIEAMRQQESAMKCARWMDSVTAKGTDKARAEAAKEQRAQPVKDHAGGRRVWIAPDDIVWPMAAGIAAGETVPSMTSPKVTMVNVQVPGVDQDRFAMGFDHGKDDRVDAALHAYLDFGSGERARLTRVDNQRRRDAEATLAALGEVREAMKSLDRRQIAAENGLAELRASVGTLLGDLGKVRGTGEMTLRARVDKLHEDSCDRYRDLDKRLAKFEGTGDGVAALHDSLRGSVNRLIARADRVDQRLDNFEADGAGLRSALERTASNIRSEMRNGRVGICNDIGALEKRLQEVAEGTGTANVIPGNEDTGFLRGLGTLRTCLGCGCVVSGGPTRCNRCADEYVPHPNTKSGSVGG